MKTSAEILNDMAKNKSNILPDLESLLSDNPYLNTDPETQFLVNRIKNDAHRLDELFSLQSTNDDEKLAMIKNAIETNQATCLALETRKRLLDSKNPNDIQLARQALHSSLKTALHALQLIEQKQFASSKHLDALDPKEKEHLITKIELIINILEDRDVEIANKQDLITALKERLLEYIKPGWSFFKTKAPVKDVFALKAFVEYLPENWALNAKTVANAYIYKTKLDKLTTGHIDLQLRCAQLKEPSIFSLRHSDPIDLNAELNSSLIEFNEWLKRLNLDKKDDLVKHHREQFDKAKVILNTINTILERLESLKQTLDITKPNIVAMNQIETLTQELKQQVSAYHRALPDEDFSDLEANYQAKRQQILIKIDEKQKEINKILADVAKTCEEEYATEAIQKDLADLQRLRNEITSASLTKSIADYEDELEEISLSLLIDTSDDMMDQIIPIVFENIRYAIIALYQSLLTLPHKLDSLEFIDRREKFYQNDLKKAYGLIQTSRDKIDSLQTDLINLIKLRSTENRSIDLENLNKHHDIIMQEVANCKNLSADVKKLEQEHRAFKVKTGGIIYGKLEIFLSVLQEEMGRCRRKTKGIKHQVLATIFERFNAATQEYLTAMKEATDSTTEEIKCNFHKKLLEISIKSRVDLQLLSKVMKKGKVERNIDALLDSIKNVIDSLLTCFFNDIKHYKKRSSVDLEKLRHQAGMMTVLTNPDLRAELFTPEAWKEMREENAKKHDLPEAQYINLDDANNEKSEDKTESAQEEDKGENTSKDDETDNKPPRLGMS